MCSVAKYLLMLCLNQSINTWPISQKLCDLFAMYFNYLVLKLTITVKFVHLLFLLLSTFYNSSKFFKNMKLCIFLQYLILLNNEKKTIQQ